MNGVVDEILSLRNKLDEANITIRNLQNECDRLEAENRFVATYHPGWEETMEAYKRGRLDAIVQPVDIHN